MFYVAHLIQRVHFLQADYCTEIPLWENLVLVEAESVDMAYELAERMGKESEDLEGFTCNGQPAELRFVGVRKLISIVEDTVTSGVELSYLQMEVSSEEDLNALMSRRPVNVAFNDLN